MSGRMKGQAFVTFPTVDLARDALTTVNGYIFKEKPIVVVSDDILLHDVVFWKAKLMLLYYVSISSVCFKSIFDFQN
jgi:RNA recognition motif-containing protein